ncbi:toxin-antitoxin system YwqK family antitoxin [Chromobacterium sp. ASV23]|uniref:toxin-antitoxin system YwqK family antitoxin n=1 Tax=Chromobacterium sp. ASV23 TaxID=2795110 RepID=UPI0018EBD48B|nr:hypothetical protein [Chromobacterium sp. ASV23]
MKRVPHAGWLAAAMLVALSGCAKPVLEYRNAEIVNGKLYASGANEPFSGKVTNMPEKSITDSQTGLMTVRATVGNVMSRWVTYPDMLCDLKVEQGLPDGEVTCLKPQSTTLLERLTFDHGTLDGPAQRMDPSGDHPVWRVSFRQGQADGMLEVFSPSTGKLIYHVKFERGVPTGMEEAFDETTGAMTGRAQFENGKYQGEVVRYAADGKRLLYQAHYIDGFLDGVEEAFDAATGKPQSYAVWKHGGQVSVLLGPEAIQAHIGQSNRTSATLPSDDIDACQSAWITAYRKTQPEGDSAIVTQDQLMEWEDQCKQGKRPA